VQAAAMRARAEDTSFLDALVEHPEVSARLDETALRELFDPEHHLRHVDAIFARVHVAVAQARSAQG